jgi:uncharacterized protein (TIGR02466 family)
MKAPVNTSLRVMELFPTPVFVIQTEGLDNEQLARQIYAVREDEQRRGIADKTLSNLGGFRSYSLLKDPGFAALRHHILKTLNESMVKGQWFAEPEVVDAQFGAMWGVINGRGHANATHNHPDAWLSGVYYVKVPSDASRAGSIGFRDPNLARSYTQTYYRTVQSDVCLVPPEAGKLVMFPGWCEHFVGPNQTDEDRIAIAFNITHHKSLR